VYSVYIVDDESLFIKDFINSTPWLEYGFEVMGFHTNPKTAIEEIAGKKPDVVFCDLKMPGCDGIEVIRRLKDSGTDAEFIMLSAYGEFEATREFFRMNGLDYILKPLDRNNAGLVFDKISRKLADKYKQNPSVRFIPSQSKSFDDLVTYVTENFNKKHTLNDLNNMFNMNPSYICTLFTKHYESTLTMFVTHLRMREASRLILETYTPFKEISTYCGYPNYYHFCRLFKNHFGKSPTEHREAGG
jgi:YesN/AraC family two-component response regulator